MSGRRRNIHKKSSDHIIWQNLFWTILAISIAIWMILIASRHTEYYAQVESAVNGYYIDPSSQIVNPNKSADDVESLKKLDQSLNPVRFRPIKKQIKQILQGYDQYAMLEQYFTHHPFEKEATDRPLILKDGVTAEDLSKALAKLDKDPKTPQTDQIKAYLEQGLQTLKELAEIENTIQQIDLSGDPLKQLPTLAKMRKQIIQYQEQPHTRDLLKRFDQAIAPLGEAYLKETEYFNKHKDQAELLLSLPSLASVVAGQPYDNRPLAALTFDDGPSELTPQFLDILAKYHIRATFFQMGRSVENYPEIAKMVADAGHQIANHSMTHPNFDLLTEPQIVEQVTHTDQLILQATGKQTQLIRPPYGNGVRTVQRLFPDHHVSCWNVDSDDWSTKDPKQIVRNIEDSLQKRSIILMHDIHQQTLEALPAVIEMLIEKGYHFVMPEQIKEADTYYVPS